MRRYRRRFSLARDRNAPRGASPSRRLEAGCAADHRPASGHARRFRSRPLRRRQFVPPPEPVPLGRGPQMSQEQRTAEKETYEVLVPVQVVLPAHWSLTQDPTCVVLLASL